MSTKTSQSLKATKAKRKTQTCKVFEVKVDKSHLSSSTLNKLNLLFLEAKWLYNHYLANEPLTAPWNQKQVQVKVKDTFENRDINITGAHIKQEILQQIKQSILNLSRAKKKGRKVGRLKYKSEINTLNLKEYNNTYRIKGSRIKIPNIPYLRVNGLKQLEDYELANAKLIRKAGDYYFHITCYKDKEPQTTPPGPPIGIDLGVKHQLTLSNGVQIDYQASSPEGLKNKYQRFSKKKKRSKNQHKAKIKIQKAFQHWNNQKKDTTNKITKVLKDTFSTICYQNDNIQGWQRLWGRKSLSTSLGGITSKLKSIETSREVNRFYPSTKTCSQCQHKKDKIDLSERAYHCEACGLSIDRDLNASINILQEGLNSTLTELRNSAVSRENIPRDTGDFKPVEMEASALLLEQLNAIPRVKGKHLSMKQETLVV